MGARQSKRSVDITTTPKKGDADSPVVEGEGKLERIGDVDAKLTNGDIHKETEAVSGIIPFYQPAALRSLNFFYHYVSIRVSDKGKKCYSSKSLTRSRSGGEVMYAT